MRAHPLWRTMGARATGDGICPGGPIDNVTERRSCRSSAADPRACPARFGCTITGCDPSSSSRRPHWAVWRGEAPIPTSGCSGNRTKAHARTPATFAGHVGKLAVETWLGSSAADASGARVTAFDSTSPAPARQTSRSVGTGSGDRDRHRISRRGVARPASRMRGSSRQRAASTSVRLHSASRMPIWAHMRCRDRRRRQCVRRFAHAGREGRARDARHALQVAEGAAAAGRAPTPASGPREWWR